MSDARLRRVSRALALILRHDAERLRLPVDPEGFVSLSEVTSALRDKGIVATEELVREVVARVDVHKRRYTIVDDAIRANYGHSLERRIKHIPATPPEFLFHGTTAASKATILVKGLQPMGRQYVHLTTDPDLARQVGARRGPPSVLQVCARAASEDGVLFMPANEFFWLAHHVPGKYIQELQAPDHG